MSSTLITWLMIWKVENILFYCCRYLLKQFWMTSFQAVDLRNPLRAYYATQTFCEQISTEKKNILDKVLKQLNRYTLIYFFLFKWTLWNFQNYQFKRKWFRRKLLLCIFHLFTYNRIWRVKEWVEPLRNFGKLHPLGLEDLSQQVVAVDELALMRILK